MALRIDESMFVKDGGHMYFHRTVRDRTALSTQRWDVRDGTLRDGTCIVNVVAVTVDYSAIFYIPIRGETLLIYCRLAADRCRAAGV